MTPAPCPIAPPRPPPRLCSPRPASWRSRPAAQSNPGSSPTSVNTSPIRSCPSAVIRSRPPISTTSTSRARAPVVPLAPWAAAAAAIDALMRGRRNFTRLAALASLLLGCARAGGLPDDRADLLYNHYNCGGMNMPGPSILVRKKIGDHVSLAGNYYVDNITGHVDTISG